jgi:aspartate/methionine/tyrosine aminotransferase
MADQNVNLCIRCGKQRVIVKTKKEYINSSLVVTAITSCPDAACQKVVDAMLHKEKKVREKISEDHEREKVLREKRRRRSHRRKAIVTGH